MYVYNTRIPTNRGGEHEQTSNSRKLEDNRYIILIRSDYLMSINK